MPAAKNKSTLPTRQLETKTIRTKKGPDKEYVQVDERLKYFRETYGMELQLITSLVHLTDDVCVFKAEVKDKDGTVYATGYAREVRTDSSSFVNATSYVENCETSAWGRALANFGIGIDNGIASAHEVVNAINQRESMTQAPAPQQWQQPAQQFAPPPPQQAQQLHNQFNTQQQWQQPQQAAPAPFQQPVQNASAPPAQAPQGSDNVQYWLDTVASINDPENLKTFITSTMSSLKDNPDLYSKFQSQVVGVALEKQKQLTQS